MNVLQSLMNVARRAPDAAAVSDGATHWTYQAFQQRIAALAGWLRSDRRITDGDRVALAMDNSADTLALLYACWHAGLCAVPMNPKLHGREFAYMIEHSGARLCLATPAQHAGIVPALPSNLDVRLVEATPDLLERAARTAPCAVVPRAADDPAWLFYTSGTTGRPKGATLTHRNLLFQALAYYADIEEVDVGSTMLHAAPLSHGSGLYALAHLARGGHQVVFDHFDTARMFDAIARHPRVSFFAAPTMVVRLLSELPADRGTLAGLHTVIYGGGPMYVADLERALDALGPRMYQLFGQGESPMTITGLTRAQHADHGHPRFRARLASVGHARTGVSVRVADADDRDCPAGEVGEILTRSDCVMSGYWNDPRASAETLRGGWLHTGDLGCLDEDGLLTLRDRSKDLIISGGSNIYPREVEETLLRHPGVAQASVIGVPHPEWGEEVLACVVRHGDERGARASEESLDAFCLEQIARFKRPKHYRFMDELPKNHYGKVLKTELRSRWASGTAPTIQPSSGSTSGGKP